MYGSRVFEVFVGVLLFLNHCFILLFRYPYVTGTSVVALKYKDGILMASDMGG